jgi:hypothetical protein
LCNRVYRVPQLSYLFVFYHSAILVGGFCMMWHWVPHAKYMWWWVPRVMWLSSPPLLLLRYTSSLRVLTSHAPSHEPIAAPLVFLHSTNLSPLCSSCFATQVHHRNAARFCWICCRMHQREGDIEFPISMVELLQPPWEGGAGNRRGRASYWLDVVGMDDLGTPLF